MQSENPIQPGQPSPEEPKPEEPKVPAEGPQPQPEPAAEVNRNNAPETGWSFRNDDDEPASSPAPQTATTTEVSWTASEFIAHDKGVDWYLGLAGAALVACAIAYLVTEDRVTVAVIAIVAIIFGAFASRKPRVLNYRIDHDGITIADKHYPYASFRSFTVHDEGAINSIFLIPLKRFMPGLSIYFPPEQEDEILGALSNYLPHEERPQDPVDRLMRKVRF